VFVFILWVCYLLVFHLFYAYFTYHTYIKSNENTFACVPTLIYTTNASSACLLNLVQFWPKDIRLLSFGPPDANIKRSDDDDGCKKQFQLFEHLHLHWHLHNMCICVSKTSFAQIYIRLVSYFLIFACLTSFWRRIT